MNMMSPRGPAANFTIEDVQLIIANAHARIGHEGRFALTLSMDGVEDCYITHWYRPEPYAFEDCKGIGNGTLQHCLEELERYVSGYVRGLDKTPRAPVLMQAAE